MNNVFAKILRQEIAYQPVYEDEYCLAFHDIAPLAKTHVVVIPKTLQPDFETFHQHAKPEEVLGFYQGIEKTIQKLKLKNGYRLITNKGVDGGQTVYHYHVHILGGEKLPEKIL